MRFKRGFMLICLIVCLFVMASVCAGDANDTAMASENSLEINQATDDVIGVEEDTMLASSEENEILTADELSFAKLNETINANSDTDIYLNGNYKYSSGDERFERGIEISRDVRIFGNGHTIDGSGLAGIFNVKSKNAFFIGIEFCNSGHTAITGGGYAVQSAFIDNNGDEGGAMNGCIAINCTFIGNTAINGGAMYNGAAQGCNFTQNMATECGGATYGVSLTLCQFDQNYAYNDGGAMYNGNAENSTFSDNFAGNNGGAICNGNASHSNFTGNVANDGGAMYNGFAEVCNFTRNIASESGGAVYGVNITLCLFDQNYANDDGGAMYNGNAENSTFSDNFAGNNGGAICNGNASHSNFTGNVANNGGAIYNGKAVRSQFLGNNAYNDGGAIYNGNSLNSNFTGNTAGRDGGAMYDGGPFECIFTHNSAIHGGAVAYGYIEYCDFISNSAYSTIILGKEFGGEGGAIYRCNVSFSNFTDNVAANNGGAIYLGDASVCNFTGNRENGALGAIYHGKATLCKFGDGQFNPNEATINQLELTVNDTTVGYNSGEKLVFYLIVKGPISGILFNTTIKVYEGGKYLGTYYAMSGNPYANYSDYGWVVPLQKGDYIVELSMDDVAGVKGASARLKVATATSIDASNITTVYNHDGTITARLTYDDGKSPQGAVLTVNLNGKSKTYVVDKNGMIKISTKDLPVGTYTATINFASNDEYAKSTKAVKITVKKATPKLTAKAKTFKKSVKTKKYKVTLKTDLNKVMKNTKVTIKVNKKTYSAKTNSKGVATFKLTKLTKKGKYTATVKYAGSKYYNAKTVKVKITVK